MIRTFLAYLPCGSLLLAIGFVALAFVFVQRLIRTLIISRPIPQGGFASIEAEIHYVNDEPAETRRGWKYKSWFIFAGVAGLCLPLSYFVPAMVLKMVTK